MRGLHLGNEEDRPPSPGRPLLSLCVPPCPSRPHRHTPNWRWPRPSALSRARPNTGGHPPCACVLTPSPNLCRRPSRGVASRVSRSPLPDAGERSVGYGDSLVHAPFCRCSVCGFSLGSRAAIDTLARGPAGGVGRGLGLPRRAVPWQGPLRVSSGSPACRTAWPAARNVYSLFPTGTVLFPSLFLF